STAGRLIVSPDHSCPMFCPRLRPWGIEMIVRSSCCKLLAGAGQPGFYWQPGRQAVVPPSEVRAGPDQGGLSCLGRTGASGYKGPGGSMSKSILLVEQDQNLCKMIVSLLQERGHKVEQTSAGREALERAKQGQLDLVIVGEQLDDIDGIGWIVKLRHVNNAA